MDAQNQFNNPWTAENFLRRFKRDCTWCTTPTNSEKDNPGTLKCTAKTVNACTQQTCTCEGTESSTWTLISITYLDGGNAEVRDQQTGPDSAQVILNCDDSGKWTYNSKEVQESLGCKVDTSGTTTTKPTTPKTTPKTKPTTPKITNTPTTRSTSTAAPTTKPSTVSPTTTAPSSTSPPTTRPPSTAHPTTVPTTTTTEVPHDEKTTIPPSTISPSTASTSTHPPSTSGPSTTTKKACPSGGEWGDWYASSSCTDSCEGQAPKLHPAMQFLAHTLEIRVVEQLRQKE
ncbi:hypothetical protein Ddc_18763 [Ditylenchus destructor]|nr:hypothetical protein Ddc_18763 [Ditylenchus destructor]